MTAELEALHLETLELCKQDRETARYEVEALKHRASDALLRLGSEFPSVKHELTEIRAELQDLPFFRPWFPSKDAPRPVNIYGQEGHWAVPAETINCAGLERAGNLLELADTILRRTQTRLVEGGSPSAPNRQGDPDVRRRPKKRGPAANEIDHRKVSEIVANYQGWTQDQNLALIATHLGSENVALPKFKRNKWPKGKPNSWPKYLKYSRERFKKTIEYHLDWCDNNPRNPRNPVQPA